MRSLRARWLEYARTTLDASASEAQVTDSAMSFYAGALAMVDGLREALGRSARGESLASGLEREAREFRAEFLSGEIQKWR